MTLRLAASHLLGEAVLIVSRDQPRGQICAVTRQAGILKKKNKTQSTGKRVKFPVRDLPPTQCRTTNGPSELSETQLPQVTRTHLDGNYLAAYLLKHCKGQMRVKPLKPSSRCPWVRQCLLPATFRRRRPGVTSAPEETGVQKSVCVCLFNRLARE